MATQIIIKNQTANDVELEDLGITISGNETVDLTEVFTKDEILTSDDLKTYVGNGTFIVNDGTTDLDVTHGLMHVRFETEYEDLMDDEGSGTPVSDLSVLQIRLTNDYNFNENFTSIPFDTSDIQNNTTVLEWVSGDSTKIQIKEDGYYRISYGVYPNVDVDQDIYTQIIDNNSNVLPGSEVDELQDQDNYESMGASFIYHATESGWIEVQVKSTTTSGTRIIPEAYISINKLNAVKGDPGQPGSGSTINVSDNTSPSYSNVGTIDFINGVVVQDSSDPSIVHVTIGGKETACLQARITSDFTLPTSFTDVSFDTTDVESQPTILLHNTSIRDRFQIKQTGLYLIEVDSIYEMTHSNFTNVYTRLRINDSTIIPGSEKHGYFYIDERQDINTSVLVYLYDDDYVTFQTYGDDDGIMQTNSLIRICKADAMRGEQGPPGASGGDDLSVLQARRVNGITPSSTSNWQDVDFEEIDIENNTTYLQHDSTNDDRFLIHTPGTYQITYTGNNSDGIIEGRIRKNDNLVIPGTYQQVEPSSNDTELISSICVVELESDDFITFQIRGASASNLDDVVLTIVKLEGAMGPQGDPGGTDVDILEDNSTVATDINEINFTGNVDVTNNSGGKVTVNVTGGSGSAISNICQIYDSSGGKDINKNTPVTIDFDAESFKDSFYLHSNTVNESRVSVTTKGLYKISYNISYDSTNRDHKNIKCFVRKNGTLDIIPSVSYSYVQDDKNDKGTNTASLITLLNVNDYIEVYAMQAGDKKDHTALIANESWMIVELIREEV